jgi:hypothetical protein
VWCCAWMLGVLGVICCCRGMHDCRMTVHDLRGDAAALQTPQSGGFVGAVDHSEGLKANLEEEGALLQDFHIVFTCKVGACRV